MSIEFSTRSAYIPKWPVAPEPYTQYNYLTCIDYKVPINNNIFEWHDREISGMDVLSLACPDFKEMYKYWVYKISEDGARCEVPSYEKVDLEDPNLVRFETKLIKDVLGIESLKC